MRKEVVGLAGITITTAMLLTGSSASSAQSMKQAPSDKNASAVVAVKVDAFYETKDGSAQIGLIVNRLTGGIVDFQFCDGTTMKLAESAIRKTKADCSGVGGGAGSTWAAGTIGENCETLPAAARAAAGDVAAGQDAQAGTTYMQSAGSSAVLRTDAATKATSTASVAGCGQGEDVGVMKLAPWGDFSISDEVYGVYRAGTADK